MDQNDVKFVTNYGSPICPYCGHASDRGREIDSEWKIIDCKKCRKKFKARTAKIYQSITIKAGQE